MNILIWVFSTYVLQITWGLYGREPLSFKSSHPWLQNEPLRRPLHAAAWRHNMVTFCVTQADALLRLDQLLPRHLPGCSRRQCRELIAAGAVRVGRATIRQQSKLVPHGAVIEVDAPETAAPAVAPWPDDIGHIALTDDLVVVNKPAGRPSAPTPQGSDGTILTVLEARLGRLWLVHRLDVDTSGVMLMARTPDAAAKWSRAFSEGYVERGYVALVDGVVSADSFVIDEPLSRQPDQRGRHRVDPAGRQARTEVRVLARGPAASWLALRPLTGRTHQLRVHLAHIHHPLVGDRRYGQQTAAHLGLHARFIALGRARFEADLPPALLEAAAAMQLGAP